MAVMRVENIIVTIDYGVSFLSQQKEGTGYDEAVRFASVSFAAL